MKKMNALTHNDVNNSEHSVTMDAVSINTTGAI